MNYVDLVNNTGVPQTVLYNGQLEVIDAGATVAMSVEKAKAFVAECAALEIVEEIVNDLSSNEYLEHGFVWIANMTGNPDLPEQLTIPGKYNKNTRRIEEDVITNPLYHPRTLSRENDLGEEEYRTQTGVYARSLGKELIELRPYQRIRLPQHVAGWFLRRDGNQTPECRGAAIASRPKTNFEPTIQWTLNDIKLWASLLEPSIAGKIRTSEQCTSEQDERDEKKLALRRAYFLAVNPKYKLPTQEKFEALKNMSKPAQSKPVDKHITEDFTGEEVPFDFSSTPKRGRPRKEM